MSKKSRTLLLAVAGLLTAGAVAWATDLDKAAITGSAEVMPSLEEATLVTGMPAELQTEFTAATSEKPTTMQRTSKRRAISSIDDLTGKYVLLYNSRTSSSSDGGNGVNITRGTGDTIVINNWWKDGVTVKAAVNLSAKTITIPNQVVMNDSTYGDCDISAANSDASPNRSTPLTGTIDDDGNISISTLWAIYIVSGTYANSFFAAGDNTTIEVANGNMHVGVSGSTAVDWNVIVEQVSGNMVSVKNFGNHGKTVNILLNSDSTVTINNQLAWKGGNTYGDYYTYAANWTSGKFTTSYITGNVRSDAITWGEWTMYSTKKYYAGKYTDCTLTGIEFSILQPSSSLDGSGTQADPFRIRTVNDLVYISNTVNSNEDRTHSGGTYTFSRTYEGQYFVVENDIDMANYLFTPIGQNLYHHFGGIIDGQNHTLKGLYVSSGSTGFAGLIGFADTTSVIKNLKFTDVNVNGAGYYAGAVAAASMGSIDNCTVTGTVVNDGVGTGGVVGLATDVSNSSFEGTVTGNKGIAGGVAGQAYGTINLCHAIGEVYAGGKSDEYTAGGVVGTLYGTSSKCLNSYFAGVVDGTAHDNLFVGGIVGQNYRGEIDGCFATASVYGKETKAAVGGVVGMLSGTVTNSYATGYCQDVNCNYVGGIVGCARNTVIDGATVESVIKNCYYTGRIDAIDYLYDGENETRETIGQIYEGANPTVENIYFDLQMEDYSSQKYRALTSALTSSSGPSGFPSDKWTFTEGYYPRLTAIADNDAAKLSASVLVLDEAVPENTSYVASNSDLKLLGGTKAALYKNGKLVTTGYYGSISNNQYVLNGGTGVDTLAFYNPEQQNMAPRFLLLSVCPKQFAGNGTESDPFQIKTKADVMLLGTLTSAKGQLFNHVYFKQMNDIDMENDSSFLGISCPKSIVEDNIFGGIYDGDGHTMHNLWMYYITWTKQPTATSYGTPNAKGAKSILYRGFIGRIEQWGVLKNLTFASDCQFDFYGYSGAFVGLNYGLVENCRNFGTVRCYTKNGGGIAGWLNKLGTIRNCFNAGNIIVGQVNCGGIVGSSAGVIENCMNVGLIEVKQLSTLQSKATTFKYAGGIAGYTLGSWMKNLVNAGHIEASGGYAGGLFGNYNASTLGDSYAGANDTYYALDYGTVFTQVPNYTGAIAGYSYPASGDIVGVYYDRQVTGLQASSNSGVPGVSGLTTAELTNGTALEGYDTGVWTFAANQYPVLTMFSDLDVVKAAAKVVLSLQNSETVNTIVNDATMSSAQWSLTDGTKFTISGTTLKVPTVTDAAIYDTLCVTSGDFSTKYALVAVNKNPLAGTGTLEDPFQIVDPYTWDLFAHYMASTGNTFAEQYVKIMNDINFADTTFVPFGYDGTPFNGHLLGNNTTVSGISYTTTATYQGAICTLGIGGTVQDLTLEGKITTAKTGAGGFVGKMNGTLTNCVNKIAIEATIQKIGGFAGYALKEALFDHCVNEANVTSTRGASAGFAGTNDAGATFYYCTNKGTITNTGTPNNCGGFIATGKGARYIHCVNEGTVTAEKAAVVGGLQGATTGTDTIYFIACGNTGVVSGPSTVGGLLGATAASKSSPIIADSCYNTGTVTSLSGNTYGTAGLFAYISPSSTITNCYNAGTVTAEKCGNVAGVFAYPLSGSSDAEQVTITNCYNVGTISGTVDDVAGVGNTPAYCVVTGCYNTGTVTGANNVAGVCNLSSHDITMNDSWNAGDVTASGNNAGGLSGYAGYYTNVNKSFNAGVITATGSNAGGLAGEARSSFTNCYNRGDIVAAENVGGLVGSCASGNYPTEFHNCYNAGILPDTVATTGSIVGNTGTWNSSVNTAENTYYITDFGTYAGDTIGAIATTVKELAASENLPGEWSYCDEYTYPIVKGMEDNLCAKTFAVAVVLIEPDTYDNVTGRFFMGEQDNVAWSSSTDSIYINDYAFIGGPVDKMFTPVVMTATSDDGQFAAHWYLMMNAETGLDEKQLSDRQLIGTRWFNITGAEVTEPQPGNIYIRVNEYNDGTQSATKVRR